MQLLPNCQVTLVVLVIPLCMNTLIFWVVDNIAKKGGSSPLARLPFSNLLQASSSDEAFIGRKGRAVGLGVVMFLVVN